EQPLHVFRAVGLALDEDRLVADRLLLLVDRGDVLVHHLRADLHVAHGMIAEGLWVALPYGDAVLHQPAHGGLEVVVPDDAAGDAGGAGGDAGLVEHEDVLAAALAVLAQVLGQVPGRAQAVNAGTDDDVLRMRRKGHEGHPRSVVVFRAAGHRQDRNYGLTGPPNILIISRAVFKPIFAKAQKWLKLVTGAARPATCPDWRWRAGWKTAPRNCASSAIPCAAPPGSPVSCARPSTKAPMPMARSCRPNASWPRPSGHRARRYAWRSTSWSRSAWS